MTLPTVRRRLAPALLWLAVAAALVLPNVARALPVRELPFRAVLLSSSSKYKLLRSLETQERASRVPKTRIRGSAVRRAYAHQLEQRLKEELIRARAFRYDGNASALRDADDYRLTLLKDGDQPAITPVWGMDNMLAEIAADGTETFTLHLPELDSPIERGPPNDLSKRETLLTDHLMSAIAAYDDTGTVIPGSETEYNAYGTVRSGPSDRPIGFHGARRLGSTGLYYLRNRVYSPELGRFLSRDPIGFAGGFNLYSYLENGPTNGRDPLGLRGFGRRGGAPLREFVTKRDRVQPSWQRRARGSSRTIDPNELVPTPAFRADLGAFFMQAGALGTGLDLPDLDLVASPLRSAQAPFEYDSYRPNGEVFLDSSAIMSGLDYNQIEELVNLMRGRAPVTCPTAEGEYFAKESEGKGDRFLYEYFFALFQGRRNGQEDPYIAGLLQEMVRRAPRQGRSKDPRRLTDNDAIISGSAFLEGLEIITSDEPMYKHLQAINFPGATLLRRVGTKSSY